MEKPISQHSSLPKSLPVQESLDCNTNPFWEKTKETFLTELYAEFVPRWFKKSEPTLPDHKRARNVARLTAGLKASLAAASYAILLSYDFGDYELVIASAGTYFAADFFYQVTDLRQSVHKGVRRAATLAVDFLTYPFYLLYRFQTSHRLHLK